MTSCYEFDRLIGTGLENKEKCLPGFEAPPSAPSLVIAGVDEAGRGPIAGPVVAAAVILLSYPEISGLKDSKALSQEKRETLFDQIKKFSIAASVSMIGNDEIDSMNILSASLKAMRSAVKSLSRQPELVLVDGNQKPGTGIPERAIVKGDNLSASIMAASILAKVTRDRYMIEAHKRYPFYGFDEHKGYGSPRHLEALRKYGPCPLHRRSFEPMKSLLRQDNLTTI